MNVILKSNILHIDSEKLEIGNNVKYLQEMRFKKFIANF